MAELAEVGFSTGRYFLSVGGVIVAMEGDKCRENLPEEACEPIPEEEEHATIGDKRAKDMPLHIVRYFRGDRWNKKNLTWVAKRINQVVAGKAEPYEQSEAIPPEEKTDDAEREMFEKSFERPRNYLLLNAEEQWAIDKRLGILDWKGEGLTAEDKARMDAYYIWPGKSKRKR